MSAQLHRVEEHRLWSPHAGRAATIFAVIGYLLYLLSDFWMLIGWYVWAALGVAVAGMLIAKQIDKLRRPLLRIANDGVSITHAGQERYVSHSQIRDVTVTRLGGIRDTSCAHQLAIELTDGTSIELGAPERQATAAQQAIQAARGRHQVATRIDAGALERQDRGTEQWVQELQAIGAGARWSHRQASLSQDDLWALVESPASPPECRAAAAVALDLEAPPAKKRLRLTAKTTASRPLRLALEKVATTEDDEALVEALASLEASLEAPSPGAEVLVKPEKLSRSD
ncbi:MAG: hypothetical protein DRI90_09665 [Deltaproteobacteria bacterium]|nr:MAG: hypothetical protein DRI90_09665 [Deltaproteobacteria bacterium]